MPGWKSDLTDVADYAYRRLRTRLVGLTDEEYFWEPAPGCWTVRATADGGYHGDWATPVWPPPFTTIAWRLGHIINNLLDPRYATWLGLEVQAAPPASLPATADEALAMLDSAYRATRGYLDSIDETDLGTTLGPIAGPWATGDRASYILHMLDELIHHAAEVSVLRDLYRATRPPNPAIDALLSGLSAQADDVSRARSERADLLIQAAAEQRWSAIGALLEAGFPLALPDGTSALHYAAMAGARPAIDSLLAAGADANLRDGLYRATPAEWADYFNQAEAAAHLRQARQGTG